MMMKQTASNRAKEQNRPDDTEEAIRERTRFIMS